jgi:hypothetical protein
VTPPRTLSGWAFARINFVYYLPLRRRLASSNSALPEAKELVWQIRKTGFLVELSAIRTLA